MMNGAGGSRHGQGQDFNDMINSAPDEEIVAVLEGEGEAWDPQPRVGDGANPEPDKRQEVDKATLAACALLKQSDLANGERLMAHFGRDLRVMEAAGIEGGDFVAWSGMHWDIDKGPNRARQLADRIGGLIIMEADQMARTPQEERAIEDGKAAQHVVASLASIRKPDDDTKRRLAAARALVDAGADAAAALSRRKKSRRDFGVSSENRMRVKNMLEAAATYLRQPIEKFNADPLLVATLTHTLRFGWKDTLDLDCPDPDVERYIKIAIVEAIEGHRREDYATALVPVAYDAGAKAARWQAFLDRMLPSPDVQRTVQQYSGLGLLTLPLQRFMFHYGEGANGKSIFLETMVRVLGRSIAVNLPTESIVGAQDKQGGSASPDIFRLLGKRMVRILELPEGKPLQSELIKKLTGSEEIPVRTLFKGFIDFQPQAKPHMSGNGLPKITDTSNGIWRRMLFVKWPVTLAEHEQRDFEVVVGELQEEGAGILNWLVEGVIDYLQHGLFIADSVRADTTEYREESDIVMQFYRDCVEAMPGESVQARAMYLAFKDWCVENSKSVIFETRFGRDMKRHCKRDDKSARRKYLDVRLREDRPRPERAKAPAPASGMEDYVP